MLAHSITGSVWGLYHVTIVVVIFAAAVPVLPMVSPVTSCSTSVLANPFVPQAQPVSPHQAGASLIVATAPVSIIDTGTAALHSSQGRGAFYV